MFYSQCNDCNERWELGTGSTCICPEQEPVAWLTEKRYAQLHTAQRTWVGLTDEDKASFWAADQMTQKEWDELFAAIEVKLKEKNT